MSAAVESDEAGRLSFGLRSAIISNDNILEVDVPQYQTGRLQRYDRRFLEIAQDLFNRVSGQVSLQRVRRCPGSFSVCGQNSKAAFA